MRRDDPQLRSRLARLGAHLPTLEAPEFSIGEWVPAWTDEAGATHLPWFRLSPAGEAFLRDIGADGWIEPFDWPAWLASPRGKELAEDRAAVGGATAQELGKLLTAVVRSDRFSEGSLAGAYASGLLTAILRRAKDLAELR